MKRGMARVCTSLCEFTQSGRIDAVYAARDALRTFPPGDKAEPQVESTRVMLDCCVVVRLLPYKTSNAESQL